MIRLTRLSHVLLCAITSTTFAQIIPQKGAYDVGFHQYDANPDEAIELRTAVWYPTVAGAVGNSAAYRWSGWGLESPFLGVTDSQQVPSGERFPIVALSHGWGAWGGQFSYLGEALASHGYIVTAPYHSTNTLTPRADELLLSVSSLIERGATPDDTLFGIVDDESIVLGGYSWGAPTTSTALALTDRDIDAIVLIDGSSASFQVDVPVLHLGGGDTTYLTMSNQVTSPEFYALDIGRGEFGTRVHHWSFGLNGCQIRDEIYAAGIAAGATDEEARSAIQPDSFWLGCNPVYTPASEVQERMNVFATAFLDHAIKGDDHGLDLLQPTSGDANSELTISVTVDSTNARNGVAAQLTSPDGRTVGLDASTGEVIDDFDGQIGGNSRFARRVVQFRIPQDLLQSGEYVLTAVGSTVEEIRDFYVTVGSAVDRGYDVVLSESPIGSGTVAPLAEIEPIRFTLSASPPAQPPSIDDLFHAIRMNAGGKEFDFSFDGFVDSEDIRAWVKTVGQTFFGDANLDGVFNTADLTAVFEAGQYEDAVANNSTWATGDWDGNGEFDSSDLVLAFQDAGFETLPNGKVTPVPEPTISVLGLLLLFLVVPRTSSPRKCR
ncbi:MAG: hypothetical protein KDA87_16770 [Planctomycetales bacterium]|nr:hypothetical protein [Planctomycetales bacterium]